MNWNLAEAGWQRFPGEERENRGKLGDARLDLTAGRRARLARKMEEASGVTDVEAERQIKSFEARTQYPRPVSFR